MVLYPPRVTLHDLPSIRNSAGATLPRCLGGCDTVMDGRRLVCDICWKHLPRSLQRSVMQFHRTPDPAFRQSVTLEVEQTCTEARRELR
ncbi:hypothetical protein Krad_1773 [Kineococcus radiotolerans SRS30216 = ATCC BAA-149]|uniref:Uncharacterized protein n=2 Tax=Kineococcus radiotolerans TaxID=131568 RepID=A6W8X0_KINRD|nr:hypothetical protein Krad_1773 [Kineococcus radiotolerans SRS30216 = ATCC BAA-149]